jgi:hypothetical protein
VRNILRRVLVCLIDKDLNKIIIKNKIRDDEKVKNYQALGEIASKSKYSILVPWLINDLVSQNKVRMNSKRYMSSGNASYIFNNFLYQLMTIVLKENLSLTKCFEIVSNPKPEKVTPCRETVDPATSLSISEGNTVKDDEAGAGSREQVVQDSIDINLNPNTPDACAPSNAEPDDDQTSDISDMELQAYDVIEEIIQQEESFKETPEPSAFYATEKVEIAMELPEEKVAQFQSQTGAVEHLNHSTLIYRGEADSTSLRLPQVTKIRRSDVRTPVSRQSSHRRSPRLSKTADSGIELVSRKGSVMSMSSKKDIFAELEEDLASFTAELSFESNFQNERETQSPIIEPKFSDRILVNKENAGILFSEEENDQFDENNSDDSESADEETLEIINRIRKSRELQEIDMCPIPNECSVKEEMPIENQIILETVTNFENRSDVNFNSNQETENIIEEDVESSILDLYEPQAKILESSAAPSRPATGLLFYPINDPSNPVEINENASIKGEKAWNRAKSKIRTKNAPVLKKEKSTLKTPEIKIKEEDLMTKKKYVRL